MIPTPLVDIKEFGGVVSGEIKTLPRAQPHKHDNSPTAFEVSTTLKWVDMLAVLMPADLDNRSFL